MRQTLECRPVSAASLLIELVLGRPDRRFGTSLAHVHGLNCAHIKVVGGERGFLQNYSDTFPLLFRSRSDELADRAANLKQSYVWLRSYNVYDQSLRLSWIKWRAVLAGVVERDWHLEFRLHCGDGRNDFKRHLRRNDIRVSNVEASHSILRFVDVAYEAFWLLGEGTFIAYSKPHLSVLCSYVTNR